MSTSSKNPSRADVSHFFAGDSESFAGNNLSSTIVHDD
jgi:hypothetical protein